MLRKAAALASVSASLLFFVLFVSSAVTYSDASPVVEHVRAESSSGKRAFDRRQASNKINYTDPNDNGGEMLTILPGLPDLGEPINAIISGLSDDSVLTVEGFLLWATSVHFGVSCLGQANGSNQYANLGDGRGPVVQGNGDGGNGVLRWNYYDPYFGTCKETFIGGNHFRWFQQEGSNAFFLACSVELDLSMNHMIALNGYNNGRDELVGNATFSNGTEWAGHVYNTTVEYIEAGVLLNETSEGINHPSVALPNQTTQDGRVALLTIRQIVSASNSTSSVTTAPNAAFSTEITSAALLASIVFASALMLLT